MVCLDLEPPMPHDTSIIEAVNVVNRKSKNILLLFLQKQRERRGKSANAIVPEDFCSSWAVVAAVVAADKVNETGLVLVTDTEVVESLQVGPAETTGVTAQVRATAELKPPEGTT